MTVDVSGQMNSQKFSIEDSGIAAAAGDQGSCLLFPLTTNIQGLEVTTVKRLRTTHTAHLKEWGTESLVSLVILGF